VSFAQFVTGVFDLYGEAQGKRLVGDKTPIYGLDIGLLHSLWPKARFVHLIRDGRDVCLSVQNWQRKAGSTGLEENFATWNEDPVLTAAVWWQWRVRLTREGGLALDPKLYHELHYEALVNRPAEQCARLCAFLGVPYDDCMLRFYEGHPRGDPGLSSKKAWLPITPGLRDWRTQLTAEETERFEAGAGEVLDELGYPRATSQPRLAVLQAASRIRDLFVHEAQTRGHGLPAHW
jgi:hypothetical protein